MKNGFICVTIVLLMGQSASASVSISGVSIIPPDPTPSNRITIDVWGMSSYNFAGLDMTQFTAVNHDLKLDIYCAEGSLPIFDNWSHSERVGRFSAGSYELTVRAYSADKPSYEYVLNDTYQTSFTVIPEPTTILLLGLGAVMLRRGRCNTD